MLYLWLKFKGYLATTGIAFAILAGAFLYGRHDGKSDAAAEQAKANGRARRESKAVEDDVRKSSDVAVDDRLAKWMRDGKR